MRYGHGSQDAGWQGPGATAHVEAWSVEAGDDPTPVIEELGATPVGSVGPKVDRRLGLVVGLIAAVVGFGFMTRNGHEPSARNGEDIASVRAAPSAEPATHDATHAPALSVARSGVPTGTTIAIGVSEAAGGLSWLTVDGSGMSSGAVLDVAARTPSGDLVACGSASAASDDERPASDGGERVGVESVRARIPLRRHESPGTLRVTIRWRDGRDGSGWSMSGPPGCPTAPR